MTEINLETFELLATCPEEIKPVLIKEIEALNGTSVREFYKALSFSVDEENFYKAHLCLRTASQLYLIIKTFSVTSEAALFSQSCRIKWHEIFAPNKSFRVDAQCHRDPPFNAIAASKAVRQAIQQSFTRAGQKTPPTEVKEPEVTVIVFVEGNKVMISIKTGGKSLHKRGYRVLGHPAPIKETLAAALLHLMDYNGTLPLLDPMCGSGTIAIEAASLALQKACQIHRKKGEFDFEHLLLFNNLMFRRVKETLQKNQLEELPQPVYASDIEESYVKLSRENALKARVERYIQFDCKSFFDIKKPAEAGILLSNLPYDERLSEEHLKEFYQSFSQKLKTDFSGWRVGLLVATNSPWKLIGLKPKHKISLQNGSIETKLLIFDVYGWKKNGN